QVGILARIPLATGLLTGKIKKDSKFEPDDHRAANRNGEWFDRGETFAGVDYETGLEAVEELKKICPNNMSLVQFALRWILMFDAVTCAIPGAKRPAQANENFSAADIPDIPADVMEKVQSVYNKYIKDSVHHYW
ncbi:MAG: aldo/keto reductase, partial [Calditrichaceae bacterium]